MGTSPVQKETLPAYDYDLDPLHPNNVEAARRLGWTFDKDFHDHEDRYGFLVRGQWHQRPANTIGPLR